MTDEGGKMWRMLQGGWRSHGVAALVLASLPAGCGPPPPPPPSRSFEGLPVSGSLADAMRAGFRACTEISRELRCRRDGVMLLGEGPFSAALDFASTDGDGGFKQLTLWHDRDQDAVLAITRALEQRGWQRRYTGEGNRGDQAIYTRQDVPFIISMDISYWGKRRLRVLPRPRNQAADGAGS